jgi:hypothetical protein
MLVVVVADGGTDGRCGPELVDDEHAAAPESARTAASAKRLLSGY